MAAVTRSVVNSYTDAQARTIVTRALRLARQQFRKADTAGERFERELDRLIKRKKRITAVSFNSLVTYYQEYNRLVDQVQAPLTDALDAARVF